jgi:hypothetical protein
MKLVLARQDSAAEPLERDSVRHIPIVSEGDWGLTCDEIGEVIGLEQDQSGARVKANAPGSPGQCSNACARCWMPMPLRACWQAPVLRPPESSRFEFACRRKNIQLINRVDTAMAEYIQF